MLGNFCNSHNHRDIVFLDHLQEVRHCPGKRRLRRDELEIAVAAGDPTGVYVVAVLCLSQKPDALLVIRQDVVVESVGIQVVKICTIQIKDKDEVA